MQPAIQSATKKHINFDIEALRGFAAVFVIWHHAYVYSTIFAPDFTPHGFLNYGPSGHFCVLVFFVLSGYVIGLSNKKPLTWASIPLYLKKRFVRLFPIFLITLFLAALFTVRSFTLSTVIGNIFMLQNVLFANINPPTWSLQYEVIYYFLFIFVSAFRVNPYILATIFLAVGLLNFALFPALPVPILTSYSYGLVFWLLGLGISQWLGPVEQNKPAYQVLLSCILFMLCIDQFNLVDTFLHKITNILEVNPVFPASIPWDQIAIKFFDLSYLPFAVLIVLIFTGKRITGRLWLLRIMFGFSALNLFYVAKHVYQGDSNISTYTLPTIFFLASLTCLFFRTAWLERISQRAVAAGIWLGELSYGIYLVHFPLLFLFGRVKAYSGTGLAFGVRLGLLLLLTIGLSYLLERVMQPRIKALFFKTDVPTHPLTLPSLPARKVGA